MANTGFLIQPKLKKVTNDLNEFPLDVNNELCSVSGLPQATMNNPIDSSTYRILNTGTCPVDPSDEVELTISGEYDGISTFYFNAILSESLSENIEIEVDYSFKDGSAVTPGFPFLMNITTGATTGNTTQIYDAISTVTDIQITVLGVNPNPAGGKTIIY